MEELVALNVLNDISQTIFHRKPGPILMMKTLLNENHIAVELHIFILSYGERLWYSGCLDALAFAQNDFPTYLVEKRGEKNV